MQQVERLDDAEVAWVRDLVVRVGDYRAAKDLGLARQTVARAAAGLRVYVGTISIVRAAIARDRVPRTGTS